MLGNIYTQPKWIIINSDLKHCVSECVDLSIISEY